MLTELSCWNSLVGNTSARKLHLVLFAPGEVPHAGERKENVRVFCLPASLPSIPNQEWGSQDCLPTEAGALCPLRVDVRSGWYFSAHLPGWTRLRVVPQEGLVCGAVSERPW